MNAIDEFGMREAAIQKQNNASIGFGSQVDHRWLGRGKVTQVRGCGENVRYFVDFGGAGKWCVASELSLIGEAKE